MEVAPESNVVAAIDLLLTIGYIDGQLHPDEQALIRRYLDHLIEMKPESAGHVDAAYSRLTSKIAALAAEVTAQDDGTFVATRLKVRAVSVFRSFTPSDQAVALELMTAMTQADGTIVPFAQYKKGRWTSIWMTRPWPGWMRSSPVTRPLPRTTPGDRLHRAGRGRLRGPHGRRTA